MKTDTMFKSDEIEQIENAMKECLDNVAKYHYEGNQEVADFFKNEYFRLADKHRTEMKNWLAIWQEDKTMKKTYWLNLNKFGTFVISVATLALWAWIFKEIMLAGM